MNPIKRTAQRTVARLRAWRTRGGRDMARRYQLLTRLANIDVIRRRFTRPRVSHPSFV